MLGVLNFPIHIYTLKIRFYHHFPLALTNIRALRAAGARSRDLARCYLCLFIPICLMICFFSCHFTTKKFGDQPQPQSHIYPGIKTFVRIQMKIFSAGWQ